MHLHHHLFFFLLGAATLALVWALITLNTFMRLRNKVDEAWRAVEAELRHRHELVLKLVLVVGRHVENGGDVLEKVTLARADAVTALDSAWRGHAEALLTGALAGLFELAEQHPELEGSEDFRQLRAELAEIDDRIQPARRAYNAHVRTYNTLIQIYPNKLLAGSRKVALYFELESPQAQPVAEVPVA
jgi:LemA protein